MYIKLSDESVGLAIEKRLYAYKPERALPGTGVS